ncbi:MAG: MurT ligase domain-containing protein [Syntrophomonadaceae bacterium]|nr:MurT ligase domain-containing protein [Syntrophomonadaceae bacterium]
MAGKAIIHISRMLGNQGSDFPGRIALKIDPQLLPKLAGQIKMHTIIVTGTNGKTTTSKMMAAILAAAGYSLVHNSAGANMVTGITTAFINAAGITGECGRDCALLETDEANVPLLLKAIAPDYMVITNFFRDQLDRYGELDSIVRLIGDSVQNRDVRLLLNGDDPLQAYRFACDAKSYYGFAATPYDTLTSSDSREGRFCVLCGAELDYRYFHYAHLGNYECSGCGNRNPQIDYLGTDLRMETGIEFELEGQALRSTYQGFYNAYNMLAAAALSLELGVAPAVTAQAIAEYKPRAGRMEKFSIGGREVTLILVKNPTGLDQSLGSLRYDPRPKAVFFALNDNAADGRDVSWVWDADFETLCAPEAQVEHFFAAGTRGADIALRACYAGFERQRIELHDRLEAGISASLDHGGGDGCVYVLSTYTALFKCRRILSRYARKRTVSRLPEGGEGQ